MSNYRLFPSTSGPSSAVSYSGDFIAGVGFCVTGEAWFAGYWWWVCSSGQSTAATKFALWQIPPSSSVSPQLIAGSVVTSGTLTAGQWNWVPLSTPLLLSLGGSSGMSPTIFSGVDPGTAGAQYVAAVGVNGSFPDTNNTWGSGQIYPDGITSGPLTAYSAHDGSMPAPYQNYTQGLFTTAGTDPSVTALTPYGDSTNDNFWLDVQVSDTMPSGYTGSLRLWPNFPIPVQAPNDDTSTTSTATVFSLSESCALNKIWLFNPPGSTGLATRVGIWDCSTEAEVSGTDNSSPTWLLTGGSSASAGDGWMYVDYTTAGVTLPAGTYKVAFYNGSGDKIYFDSANYFFAGTDPVGGATVGGAGWNGISVGGGILTSPNVADAPTSNYIAGDGDPYSPSTGGGNSVYQNGAWAYPNTFEATSDWGESRWVDVEVTPATGGGGGGGSTPVVNGDFLKFFP